MTFSVKGGARPRPIPKKPANIDKVLAAGRQKAF